MTSRFDDLAPGALVASYRIEAALATGGMAKVYAATHRTLPRRAAIKVLHGHILGLHAAAERLVQEACILETIAGPTVVRVYDVGNLDDGRPWVAMELVDGETLAYTLHEQRRLPAFDVARVLCAIADALAVAHAHDVVHCDIKPENVIVCGDEVRVVDWGIAHVASPDHGADDDVAGTPEYMAPEQIRGGVVDARTDVYALGVVGYELLVGEPPFVSSSPVLTALNHLTEPPHQIGPLVANLPSSFDELLRSMRAISPNDRPSIATVRGCLGDMIEQMSLARAAAAVIDLEAVNIDDIEMEMAERVPRGTASARARGSKAHGSALRAAEHS